jgi:hypothetical protein
MHLFLMIYDYICRLLKDDTHVQWIDNFSKTYRSVNPNMWKGAYSNCLWTGYANKVYIGEKSVDLSVKYDDEKKIIPVMPGSLCDN